MGNVEKNKAFWQFAYSKNWRRFYTVLAPVVLVVTTIMIIAGHIDYALLALPALLIVGLLEDAVKAVADKHCSNNIDEDTKQ